MEKSLNQTGSILVKNITNKFTVCSYSGNLINNKSRAICFRQNNKQFFISLNSVSKLINKLKSINPEDISCKINNTKRNKIAYRIYIGNLFSSDIHHIENVENCIVCGSKHKENSNNIAILIDVKSKRFAIHYNCFDDVINALNNISEETKAHNTINNI